MADGPAAPPVLRFEKFEVRVETGELLKSGRPVRLQPQPFAILVALLERPGELVTREHLREKLWPSDTFVDFDKSLNIAVTKLRRRLGDSSENPRFVETLPRRGYRFIGSVESCGGGRPTGARTEPGAGVAENGLQHALQASGRSLHEKSTGSELAGNGTSGLGSNTNESSWAERYAWLALGSAIGLLVGAFAARQFNDPEEAARLLARYSFTPDSVIAYSGAAVSPDGHWIVYVTGLAPRSLWIRSAEDETPRRLAGTEDALWGPFWSPDSQFIGFAAGGELKRVGVDGGPPQVLCKLPGSNWDGAAWTPDGEHIIFSSGPAAPRLYEVSARGGEATVYLDRVPGTQAGGAGSPSFVVDGTETKALLFTWGSFTRRSVYLLDLSSRATTKLADGVFPLYSPTGHILYQTGPFEEGVWALPFSAGKLTVQGDAIPIARGVGTPSISNKGVLVTVDKLSKTNRQLVWRDRGGVVVAEAGPTHPGGRHPSLSPDGEQVAFDAQPDGGDRSDIWVYRFGERGGTRVTSSLGMDQIPTWTPDGKAVTFYSDRGGAGHIFSALLQGSGKPTALAGPTTMVSASDWSPNGDFLVYDVSDLETGFDLWTAVFEGEDKELRPRPLLMTAFNETTPQISPDGRRLAYCSDESGASQVYVQSFPDGGDRKQVSENGGCQPRWGHSSAELFYVEGNTLMAAPVEPGHGIEVGPAEELFTNSSLGAKRGWSYDVAADGRIVLVEDVGADEAARRKPRIRVTQNWYEEFRERD